MATGIDLSGFCHPKPMPAQIELDPLKNKGAVFISDEQFRTEMKCMLKLKRETLHVHTKSIFDLYDENIDSLSN